MCNKEKINDYYKNTISYVFLRWRNRYGKFFKDNGGAVLSTTFDKYCYVNVRHLPRFWLLYRIILLENRASNWHQWHPASGYPKCNEDVRHARDSSHLWSGSACPFRSWHIKLICSWYAERLYALKGKYADKKKLADEAIYLERNLCHEAGGWQDQIAASFGGFNRINFNADGYEVLPVIISSERKTAQQNLMMFSLALPLLFWRTEGKRSRKDG